MSFLKDSTESAKRSWSGKLFPRLGATDWKALSTQIFCVCTQALPLSFVAASVNFLSLFPASLGVCLVFWWTLFMNFSPAKIKAHYWFCTRSMSLLHEFALLFLSFIFTSCCPEHQLLVRTISTLPLKSPSPKGSTWAPSLIYACLIFSCLFFVSAAVNKPYSVVGLTTFL